MKMIVGSGCRGGDRVTDRRHFGIGSGEVEIEPRIAPRYIGLVGSDSRARTSTTNAYVDRMSSGGRRGAEEAPVGLGAHERVARRRSPRVTVTR